MSSDPVILACHFLNKAVGAQIPMSDDDILADCDCGTTRQLSSCPIRHEDETEYRCPSCGSILVIVARGPIPSLPGQTYRAGDLQLWNRARLSFRGTAMPPLEALVRQR